MGSIACVASSGSFAEPSLFASRCHEDGCSQGAAGEKLHELQRLWLIEATKYNAAPLDDRMIERANPELAGRPTLVRGHRQLIFGTMGHLNEVVAQNL